jgi:23S rRNA (cytidine1920-2'-O)/16S rRNA (cytidine1409-2'-O)-methyltransferase
MKAQTTAQDSTSAAHERARLRVDRLLVERGLFESRAKARAAIDAGLVVANGTPVTKPSEEVPRDAALEATAAHPFVSRGGRKLAAALDHFGFDASGRICLDAGASTGGFADVLLRRGARKVYAVDVGHDQLHASLRAHPGLVSIEGTDIRTLAPERIEPPDLIVIDVSFISLKLVLPPALALARPQARLVALIKPQFEVGRAHNKKGVVRDATIQAEACAAIADVVTALSWSVLGQIPSPILGGSGNREFLLGAARG